MDKRNKYKKFRILLAIILMFSCAFACSVIFNNDKEVYAQTSVRDLTDSRHTYTDDEISKIPYFCLKDDNIIFTPNQASFGSCWTFACTKSIETALALATGEVYDFSEAWVALCEAYDDGSYKIGGGGSGLGYKSLISKYGLVLESDMPYEVLENIDSAQREDVTNLYNYYSQFASKDYFKAISENYNTQPLLALGMAPSSSFIKGIKKQVINNGSCEISFYCNDAEANNQNSISTYYKSSFVTPNHAVTVIGWDDNITLKSDSSVKGAFIVQNSWGNYKDESYIYVMYNNRSLIESLGYSVKESNLTSFSKLTKTSSDVKNWYSNIAESKNSTIDEKSQNQGNLFYLGENLDMTYSFVNSSCDYGKVKISVYDGDRISNDLKVDKNGENVHITKDNLSNETCYKLKFHYDLDNDGIVDDGEEVYYKQIFVTSGVIFDGIYGTYLQGFQTQSNGITDAWIVNNSSVQIYIGSYSRIKSVDIVNSQASYIGGLGTTNFAPSDSDNFSSGVISMSFRTNQIYLNNEWFTSQLKFTTVDGYEKILRVHYMKVSDFDADLVNLIYLTNYKNVQEFPKIYSQYSTMKLQAIEDFEKYYMEGWYTDKDFANKVNNNILDSRNIKKVDSKTSYYHENKRFNYAYLYPKFDEYDLVLKDVTLNNGTYNTSFEQSINCVQSGKGDYTYSIKSGELPNGLSIVGNKMIGLPLQVGNFTITLSVKDNFLNITKDCQISVTIQKMALVYHITPSSSSVYDSLSPMSVVLVSGSINQQDGDVVEIDYSNVNTNQTGKYNVSLINKKQDLYNISLDNPQDAVYTITSAQVKLNVSNYEAKYDGKYHTVNAVVTNLDENQYFLQYSVDGENYSNNASFKDTTNGEVIVYVKAVSRVSGYENAIKTATIKIDKVALEISLLQRELEYNTKEQQPSIFLTGAVNGENPEFYINAKFINVGVHTVTVSLKDDWNKNYVLSQNTVEFEIVKISPTYEIVKMDSTELSFCKTVSDLELPIVPEGFTISFVDPEQKLVVGNNVVKIKITPEESMQENYKESIFEINVYKPSVKLEVSSTFYIVLGIIVFSAIFVGVIIIIMKSNKEKQLVNISFVSNSTLPVTSIKGKKNKRQVLPEPFKPGSKFMGWYEDKNLTKPYSDNGEDKNKTLYAKWEVENRQDVERPNIDMFRTYKK